MKGRLPRTLGDDFLPRTTDVDAAEAEMERLNPLIEDLRRDVAKYGTTADRARLARSLIRRAECELLCGRVDRAPADFEDARELLEHDGREAPLLILDARASWMQILRGEPNAAVHTLARVVQSDALTVKAWRDQFLLWLAAGQIAQKDIPAALDSLEQARAIYRAQPKRDSTLVDAAYQRLQRNQNH